MKINFLQKAISFESKKLYRAQIQQQKSGTNKKEPVDVYITRLDRRDLTRLKKDRNIWRKTRTMQYTS